MLIFMKLTHLNVNSVGQNFKLDVIWMILGMLEIHSFFCGKVFLYKIHMNVSAKYLVTVCWHKQTQKYSYGHAQRLVW